MRLFHHAVLARFWLLPARLLHLTNTVSGRRSFRKQSPEFCIECHTATSLAGRIESTGRISSNTIRRDSLGGRTDISAHKYLSANAFKFRTLKSTAFGMSPASVSITSESESAVAVIGQSGRSFIFS